MRTLLGRVAAISACGLGGLAVLIGVAIASSPKSLDRGAELATSYGLGCALLGVLMAMAVRRSLKGTFRTLAAWAVLLNLAGFALVALAAWLATLLWD